MKFFLTKTACLIFQDYLAEWFIKCPSTAMGESILIDWKTWSQGGIQTRYDKNTFLLCKGLSDFKMIWQKCSLGFLYINCLTLSHLQQICSRRLWKHSDKFWKISIKDGFIFKLSWKHCGQRRNCSSWAISPLATYNVFKSRLLLLLQNVSPGGKGLSHFDWFKTMAVKRHQKWVISQNI